MILESLQLCHAGPIRRGLVLGPFSSGLNILCAPNESGKSTLIKTAIRAFFDRHTCKDAEIRSLQPSGTDLSPTIKISFWIAGRKYLLQKNFLVAPRSTLSEWVRDQWEPVAEGDKADQRLLELFQGIQTGRGASKAAHWGLLRFLWTQQGEALAWPDWAVPAGQQIRSRLARVHLDARVESLIAGLWEEYLVYFTASGQVKTGGPLKLAEIELESLNAGLASIESRKKNLEEKQNAYRNVESAVTRLEIESKDHEIRGKELRELAIKAENQRRELEKFESELQGAKERLSRVSRDSERLSTLQAGLEQLTRAQPVLVERLARASEEEARISGLTLFLESDVERQDQAIGVLSQQASRTRCLMDRSRVLLELEQSSHRQNRIYEQKALKERLQNERAGIPSITSASLAAMEKIEQTIRESEIRISSVGLRLEINPDKDCSVSLTGRDPETLQAKTVKVLSASQKVEVTLHGWGTVVVRSGSTEAQKMQEELDAEKARIQKMLRDLCVESTLQARQFLERDREISTRITVCESTLGALLGSNGSVERFEQTRKKDELRLQTLDKELQVTAGEKVPSLLELETEDARIGLQARSLDVELKTARLKLRAVREEFERARLQHAEILEAIRLAKSQEQTVRQQITDLRGRYEENIDRALQNSQNLFAEAEARFNYARSLLPENYLTLPERSKRLSLASEQVFQELARNRNVLAQAEGELRSMGAEGVFASETILLEKKELSLERVKTARTRGWGLRIAHDLLRRRQAEAIQSVLAPLESQLSSTFAEISGDHHRQVFLNQELEIEGVGRNREELVPFEGLSQGAKEQLILSLRLAVALELRETEPQLLVLDDVLVNTDAARQSRLLELLEQGGQKLQILVMTCHPEHYRGVGKTLALTDC